MKENKLLSDIMNMNMMLVRGKIKPMTDAGFTHKDRRRDFKSTTD